MNSLASTTALILAGGLGTRLRSAVPDRPKVIAEVGGRPFIAYLLDQLVDAGVTRIVLCTGYQADRVEACLGPSYRSAQLLYSPEANPLGTGGALRLALPLIQSPEALVLNGDSYCDVPLPDFAAFHYSRDAQASLALCSVDDQRRYGGVRVDEQGAITAFAEKADVEGPGWVNAGVYLLRRSLLESIPPGTFVSLEREVLPGLISRGLFGFCSSARFRDIGVPEAYSSAQSEFSAGGTFETHR